MPAEPQGGVMGETSPEVLARGISLRQLTHDLNNFLGIILGNSELLRDHELDAKTSRRVEAIHQAAERARDLVAEAQQSISE